MVRIGSFNMRKWGENSKRDIEIIANMIRDEELDVVAFQEIFIKQELIQLELQQLVNYHLPMWDCCWDKPSQTTDSTNAVIHNESGEGYAYIWNKRKFKLAEVEAQGEHQEFKPKIINRSDVNIDCSHFARTPYYIRLEPCYGGFWELRLINIHIYFGTNSLSSITKRQIEYADLTQKIYPQISQIRYGNSRPAYTIAMGDYNLNIIRPLSKVESPEASLIDVITIPKYGQVKTIQEQLTVLKQIEGYSNNYDHFEYSPDKMSFSLVSCRAIDAVNKYYGGNFQEYKARISDHLPIVMEFKL